MTSVSREVTIVNKLGLHARAAAKLVNLAGRHGCEIELVRDGKRANAKSIMSVMMLAATRGTALRLEANGEDAQAAVDALEQLIADRFEESE